MVSSRRGAIAAAIIIIGAAWPWVCRAQTGLDQFASSALACKTKTLTPAVPPDAHYRAGAPLVTSLAPAGAPGTRLILTGTVSGLACGPITGAVVEFWQADARGRWGASALRGREVTDANGSFRVETVVPGAAPGHAPRIGVHVRVPGEADFWTAVFMPDNPANTHDPDYRPALALKLTDAGATRTATFDIVLDL